jgi:dipeptidyl-peptidase-4
MGTPQDNPDGYKETASISHAKTMDGHLLLMHGMVDDNVHAQNTYRLVEALIKAKKANYDVMLYPKRAHGIGGARLDVYRRLVRFFEEHL